jgi:AcrR family transcriptional regulator
VAKTGTDVGATGRPGRPRRFEAAEERQRIFDAAFEVMRRNGYGEVTVGDILAEAGVSTRSFYRHFDSKEALLAALFRQDAEQFSDAVTVRVHAAPNPSAALEVWIDEILGFGLGRGRAKRAAVLGSPAAMGSLAPEVLAYARELLLAPLIAVLSDGVAEGTFASTSPVDDAGSVSAVAWEASNRLRSLKDKAQREATRDGALAFVHRALGVTA